MYSVSTNKLFIFWLRIIPVCSPSCVFNKVFLNYIGNCYLHNFDGIISYNCHMHISFQLDDGIQYLFLWMQDSASRVFDLRLSINVVKERRLWEKCALLLIETEMSYTNSYCAINILRLKNIFVSIAPTLKVFALTTFCKHVFIMCNWKIVKA